MLQLRLLHFKLIFCSGETVLITRDLLDASEIKANDPNFLIIRQPAYAKLIRINTTDAGAANRTAIRKYFDAPRLTVFTYRDVLNRQILYVNTLKAAAQELEDGFEYEVRADRSIQPARAVFPVRGTVNKAGFVRLSSDHNSARRWSRERVVNVNTATRKDHYHTRK